MRRVAIFFLCFGSLLLLQCGGGMGGGGDGQGNAQEASKEGIPDDYAFEPPYAIDPSANASPMIVLGQTGYACEGNAIVFNLGNTSQSTVELCDKNGEICVEPVVGPPVCVFSSTGKNSCINTNTVGVSYFSDKGPVLVQQVCSWPTPFCANVDVDGDGPSDVLVSSCSDTPATCVDQPNSQFKVVEELGSKTLPDGTEIQFILKKDVLTDNTWKTKTFVTGEGGAKYPDVCKDPIDPSQSVDTILMEQVCRKTKISSLSGNKWAMVHSAIPVDCTDYNEPGKEYVCWNGRCVAPDEECLEGIDPECTDPEIPEFDCDWPIELVQTQFPGSVIQGTPGHWHVSLCSVPEDVFKMEWVTHLVCYKFDSEPKAQVFDDTVHCPNELICENGTCSGKKEPYCIPKNVLIEDQLPNVTAPGFIEVGLGVEVWNQEKSKCDGLLHVDYPLCSKTEAGEYFWEEDVPCPPGWVCVEGPDGGYCQEVEECQEDGGNLTLIVGDDAIELVDKCTGKKVSGKASTTAIIDWECTDEPDVFNFGPEGPPLPDDCPEGTECCVNKETKQAGCWDKEICPPNGGGGSGGGSSGGGSGSGSSGGGSGGEPPPDPEPVVMDFTCEDDDAANHPQIPGTVTLIGTGAFDPGVTYLHSVKDTCHGLYKIKQYCCKADGTGGLIPAAKADLLGKDDPYGGCVNNYGPVDCTALLELFGIELGELQIGICEKDPGTGAGICTILDLPPPPEPPDDPPPDDPPPDDPPPDDPPPDDPPPDDPPPDDPPPVENPVEDPPPALKCNDTDDDEDPAVAGVIKVPNEDVEDGEIAFKSQEDYCIGDFAVVQFKCDEELTEKGNPKWKQVTEVMCNNGYIGCAQGKCCLQGSIEIAFEVRICVEDL